MTGAAPTHPRRSSHPRRPLPFLMKLGFAVLMFGVLYDVVEHTLGVAATGVASSGFSAGEHAAHAMVLLGMVLVLAGVVADGARRSSRNRRPERSSSDALR